MKLTLDLPELERFDDAEAAAREFRLAAALYWYASGEMSSGAAARVAGIDRWAFLEAASARQINTFQADAADLADGTFARSLPPPANGTATAERGSER